MAKKHDPELRVLETKYHSGTKRSVYAVSIEQRNRLRELLSQYWSLMDQIMPIEEKMDQLIGEDKRDDAPLRSYQQWAALHQKMEPLVDDLVALSLDIRQEHKQLYSALGCRRQLWMFGRDPE